MEEVIKASKERSKIKRELRLLKESTEKLSKEINDLFALQGQIIGRMDKLARWLDEEGKGTVLRRA